MKKVAFVLGYAGSILALIFTMLMIITVPLNLADKLLKDVTEDLKPVHILALNDTAIRMGQEGWTDFSEDGLREIAGETAKDSNAVADADVYDDAVKFAYKEGLNAIIAIVVVAAAIVFAIVSLIGALIVKKAPTAGGVLLLLTAFLLLLASIYTSTLVPTFIASLFLALGGIAVFIPERVKRPVPATATGQRIYTPPYAPQYAPPQTGYAPQYVPQAAPAPVYAPPQTAPVAAPAPTYAPPQTAPVLETQAAPSMDASGETNATGGGLPFPEEEEKPGDSEA